MALLRFTNPTDIPAYGDCDFVVFGAESHCAEDMRDVYAKYLENHRRYHSNIPKHWGRHSEAERVAELHSMLVEACEAGREVSFNGRDYVWAFANHLMFEKRFVSVWCPECGSEYGPEACQVIEWSFGRELWAHGGRRVVCPASHTMYSCMEWNSLREHVGPGRLPNFGAGCLP